MPLRPACGVWPIGVCKVQWQQNQLMLDDHTHVLQTAQYFQYLSFWDESVNVGGSLSGAWQYAEKIFALNTIEKDGSKLILVIQLFLLQNPYPVHIPPLMVTLPLFQMTFRILQSL